MRRLLLLLLAVLIVVVAYLAVKPTQDQPLPAGTACCLANNPKY